MTHPWDGVLDYLRGPHRNRRLLDLIYASVQRLENAMSAQSEYMTTALAGLDTQMTNLQARLADEAQVLADAIANAQLGAEDEVALKAAADRVQATADLVGTLAVPSAVADPETPDVADPLV